MFEAGDIIELQVNCEHKNDIIYCGALGKVTYEDCCGNIGIDFIVKNKIVNLYGVDTRVLKKVENQEKARIEFEKTYKNIKGANKMIIDNMEWQSTSTKREDEIDEALSKIERQKDFIDKAEFEKIVNEQLETCKKVLCSKAKEYATADRLHNFKVAANIENCTPIGALGGMMAKHTVSVYDMINGTNDGFEYPSEMWNEKITDSINYLILLKALVVENNRTE